MFFFKKNCLVILSIYVLTFKRMNYFYKKRMRSFLLKYSKKNDGGIVRFSKLGFQLPF